MYGEFFRKKFEQQKKIMLENNVMDIVFYDPYEIIDKYYENILKANSEEEIYRLLVGMYDVASTEGSKNIIYSIMQVNMQLLNYLQDNE